MTALEPIVEEGEKVIYSVLIAHICVVSYNCLFSYSEYLTRHNTTSYNFLYYDIDLINYYSIIDNEKHVKYLHLQFHKFSTLTCDENLHYLS
jgi:uncharacterized membrane protein